MTTRHALVVRGGWDGHRPVEATGLYIPFLEANGFAVRVEESPDIYADAAVMAATAAEEPSIAGRRSMSVNGRQFLAR